MQFPRINDPECAENVEEKQFSWTFKIGATWRQSRQIGGPGSHPGPRRLPVAFFFLARSSATTTTTATTVGGRNGRSCWRAASLFIAPFRFFWFQIKTFRATFNFVEVNSNEMLKDEPQSIGQSFVCHWNGPALPVHHSGTCEFRKNRKSWEKMEKSVIACFVISRWPSLPLMSGNS